MPVAGGGFEQCYNAQAVVATTVAQVHGHFLGGDLTRLSPANRLVQPLQGDAFEYDRFLRQFGCRKATFLSKT
jgi:hypothetical protein